MSTTPKKPVCNRGRKPKIDIQNNSSCRLCGINFTSGGGRASSENLFSPSGREESVGLILAECCGSIGFPLTRDENLSERFCRSCGRKIRNAAELYSFIEQVVCSTRVADEDLNCKDSEERCKRQLLTTVTPERIDTKKLIIGTDSKHNQKSTRKLNSKKALFSESLRNILLIFCDANQRRNHQNRCFTINFKILGANKHLIYEAFAMSFGQHR